jgi:hypothetical protein
VFKATYNGEAVAAKEMEIGQSPAGQEAFLNVRAKPGHGRMAGNWIERGLTWWLGC